MAGMEKQVAVEDLHSLSEMEEGLKKLQEEVRVKGVDEQEMTMNFEETGEKKVTREGRGCAGLVQGGGDETHRDERHQRKRQGKR